MVFFWIFAGIVLVFGFVVFWGAPYVPSKKKDLAEALDTLYKLGEQDVLVDVGSGDGTVLRAAAKRGARVVGYELNPLLAVLSRWLSHGEKRVSVRIANFWLVHFPADTTVVYVFCVSRDAKKMVRKLSQEATRLGRPLTLITYGCEMPGMTPLKTQSAHLLYEFTPLQQAQAQV